MIGTTLSHYKIDSELGRGGMGVVYAATDDRLQRKVAIKVLPPVAARDPRSKERFIQEARAASAFDHPNICTIHDIGETDAGELFLVMPLYEGGTLRDRMEDGPMAVEDAVGFAVQIAKGLGRAHDAGIVHRDVKPDNLMVQEDRLVKILDFGVAKLAEGLELTVDGSTVGTAAYMSPEQARGEKVDGRSDLWAIGAILYEALSGRRPFPGGYDQAVLYGILNVDPEPLTEAPEDLSAIVLRLLEKNRDARFGTAQEVVEALRPFGSDGRTGVASAEPRKRSLVPVVAAAAVGIAVILAVMFLLQRSSEPGSTIVPDPALAVLPFSVQGSAKLAYLDQGIPTLLSVAIDGMGDLRAVDPLSVSSVLGDGRVDASSARNIAQQFDAEGVIIGSVVQLGDELRLQAAIYDANGTPGETVETTASNEAGLATAVDQLARLLISERFEGRGEAMAGLSAITSRDFGALRDYMEGEELARDARWGEAYEAFSRAVEKDSTFALAWYRMSSLSGWPGVSGDDDQRHNAQAAKRHAAGLPRRALSVIDAQLSHAFDSTWIAMNRWENYVAHYPDDAHAWFRLGDLTLHGNPWRGRSDRLALPLLRKALRLDPNNHEAAVHLVAYAIKDRDWELVDSMHGALGDISNYSVRVDSIFASAGDDEAVLLESIHDLAATSTDAAAVWFKALSTSLSASWPEIYVAVVDSLMNAGHPQIPKPRGVLYAIPSLIQMGRLRDAAHAIEVGAAAGARVIKVAQASIPLTYAPSADSLIRRTPDGAASEIPFYKGMLAWYEQDWPAVKAAIDSLSQDSGTADELHAKVLESLMLWKQGELDAALAMIESANLSNGISGFGSWPADVTTVRRWVLAELLFQAGRYDEARRWYQTFNGLNSFLVSGNEFYSTPAHRRLAEIARMQRDNETAIYHLEQFIHAWRNADPELQADVAEAQAVLDDLLGSQAREPNNR